MGRSPRQRGASSGARRLPAIDREHSLVLRSVRPTDDVDVQLGSHRDAPVCPSVTNRRSLGGELPEAAPKLGLRSWSSTPPDLLDQPIKDERRLLRTRLSLEQEVTLREEPTRILDRVDL